MSGGPTEAAGLHVVAKHTDDGRYLHRFRQSWLKETDTCLEKSRLKLVKAFPDETSDAAAAGTAVHAGIEVAQLVLKEYGTQLDYEAAVEHAQETFTTELNDPGFRWTKMTERGARLFVERALKAFYREVYPQLQPLHTELSFGPLILHEDDKRVIEVTGTIDCVDAGMGAVDWKTAGQEYTQWEHDRWAVQPTVYLWALWKMGMLEGDGPWPFTFIVFLKGMVNTKVQRLTVTRHKGDFAWLEEKCVALAELIEADLTVWPKSDNHALCSPTWCPAFAAGACKGTHFTPSWPKPSEPAVDGVQQALTMVTQS